MEVKDLKQDPRNYRKHGADNLKLIKKSVDEFDLPIDYIAENIGATKQEIELLLMDNVFKKLDIENHKYSKAWIPKGKRK